VAWLLFVAAGLVVVSGCRQDMHNQPKFIPLRSSEFYPDHRSARYPVPGTVSRTIDGVSSDCAGSATEECRESLIVDREQLDPGSYFLTGKHGNAYGNELPLASSTPEQRMQVLVRGQERFNIYCTPCHARVGDGNGMIVQRGFKRPPSFHAQRLRNAPLGYFYDVISNGFGGMPDYASQVRPADRWAIAAYIRALQYSQKAPETSLAQEDRDKLSKPGEEQIRIPDTSYIAPVPGEPRRPAAEPARKAEQP
jgi:mono/diheme cytochrome c family protein